MLEKTRLEMSNEEELLLPLKTILVNLKVIASKVRTNPSFRQKMEEQLWDCGYDWFGGISNSDEEQLKEQVMKALDVAVRVAIQKKVDLGYGNKVVNPELHQLLDNGRNESLDHHFIPVDDPSEFELLRSPLDLAKYLKKTKTINAPHWLVKNIIQHQFDIRWNTLNGDPDDYTFYEFCDNRNTAKLLKYIPRQAHVKATLYKECRKINVSSLREITEKKENLCPTVYIRTTDGWKSWRANEDKFYPVKDIKKTLSWINSSIRTFITENADEQNVNSLKKSLANRTLYWAVLDDSDFKPGGKLKLKEIGRTQVYVGRTNKGIKGRWTGAGNNHCEKMKKCLDNVCDMTTIMTYDPSRLEGITLVDARLVLAKVRGKKTALFVIKTFGESSSETSEDEESDATESVERIVPDIVPNPNPNTDPLTEAEKWHREGKRVDNEHSDIIPLDDDEWKPKDMRYGMNRC